jgi:hypothetical protein
MPIRVWGLTADEYASQHGGQGGDLCVDQNGDDRCLNDKGDSKFTWLRGRAGFGHGPIKPRLGATCSGPCRIPGHPGPRGQPSNAATDWDSLDQLANHLYKKRGDLGLSDAASLPTAKPGLLVLTEASAPSKVPNRSTAETPATLLTGESGPANQVILLYYKVPPGAHPGEWLSRTHPAVASCSQKMWLWTPVDHSRIFPVSSFRGIAPKSVAGASTAAKLGSPSLRAGYLASRKYADAYAAAWSMTPRAAIDRWVWVYDHIVALEWKNFDSSQLTEPCKDLGRHDIHMALQFLTEDGMPPADQLTPVVGGKIHSANQLTPTAERTIPPAPTAPMGVPVTHGITNIHNNPNSVIVVINGGTFTNGPNIGMSQKGDQGGQQAARKLDGQNPPETKPNPPEKKTNPPETNQRHSWSWWLRQSMTHISGRHGIAVSARRLLSMDMLGRNDALRWLINVRGLTYASGMSPEEYVAAADTKDNRERFMIVTGTSVDTQPVGDYPSATWADRIPYAMAPISTIMCLDQAERRKFLAS